LDKEAEKERQHESAKAAILRFLEGDRRSLQQMCWTHWVHFAEREAVHRGVAERDAQVQDLETRLEANISRSKTHLLKYVAQMAGSANDPAFLKMVLHQWQLHSKGEKSAEMMRKLELSLREQERLHDIKVTQDKEKKLQALENMGFKSSKAELMKIFLLWSGEYQKDRQKRLHKMAHSSVLEKFGQFTEGQSAKKNAKETLATCFQEWVRDMHKSKHSRMHDWHTSELENQRTLVAQLTQERILLSEQLQVVYQQLDAVTDTLQKELKTKEELAKELREANEQIFNSNFGGNCHIDVASIIANSRPSTPGAGTELFSRDVKTFARSTTPTPGTGSEPVGRELKITPRGPPSDNKGATPGLLERGGYSRTKTPPKSPPEGNTPPRAGRSPPGKSPRGAASETSGLSPESTISSCNWTTAIPRMREQGILGSSRF